MNWAQWGRAGLCVLWIVVNPEPQSYIVNTRHKRMGQIRMHMAKIITALQKHAFERYSLVFDILVYTPDEIGHHFNRPPKSFSSLLFRSQLRERTFKALKVFISHRMPGRFPGCFCALCGLRACLALSLYCDGLPRFPAHLRGCPVPSGIRWGL